MVESVTCAVCTELYEVPVQAPLCGHAFCRACLLDCCAVDDTEQAKCPLCRKELVAAPWPAARREPYTSRQATAIAAWPEAVVVRGMADLVRGMLPPPSSPTAASALLRYSRGAAAAASADRLRVLVKRVSDSDACKTDSFGRSIGWWLLYFNVGYGSVDFVWRSNKRSLFAADKAGVMPFTLAMTKTCYLFDMPRQLKAHFPDLASWPLDKLHEAHIDSLFLHVLRNAYSIPPKYVDMHIAALFAAAPALVGLAEVVANRKKIEEHLGAALFHDTQMAAWMAAASALAATAAAGGCE